jgi:acyl dehydratase
MLPPIVTGPYFEDLVVGQVFSAAPGVTITEGLAAVHQSITGGRLVLTLDHNLCRKVTGSAPMASPSLVWDLSIGQSTIVTQHVKANLFYRGLVFHRLPLIGDTLHTSTEVVALRQNRRREGRDPTGLVALRVVTLDQDDQTVLDFWRCAMLPLRDVKTQRTEHEDDLDTVGAEGRQLSDPQLLRLVSGWQMAALPPWGRALQATDLRPGQTWPVPGGDVVSGASELARLTVNIAAVHHDSVAAGGQRLVYGGHVIGIALAQATRLLPSILTLLGWHACDHLGPVHEGDTLRSAVTVERVVPLRTGGALAHLRSVVGVDARQPREVLDWRYVAVVA